MKKKITIIGACSLAAVIGAVTIMSGTSTDENKKVEENKVAETEVETAVASGNVNVSSVGVSSVITTMDTTDGNVVAEATGDVGCYSVGFADIVEAYNEYLYNSSEDTAYEAEKSMDIATETVPEGSIIDGYTNLGISNATTYLNVRKGAGTDYKIVGKMPGYSVCEILEEKDGWYKIKSGEVTGYVSADYILTGYEANVKAQEKMTEVLVVNCDKLNVREEPSTDCSIATKVANGEHLEIVEDVKDGWYKVEINGLSGYVSADYVSVVYSLPTAVAIQEVVVSSGGGSGQTYTYLDSTVSQTAYDLINYAYQFLGNPYKYGGNSLTSGIDCSGFVKQIFAKFGYTLPRTSSAYGSVGTSIPLSQIKAGDILVYKYSSGGGHVAIYIGNGQIIHAANARSGICIGNAYFVTPYKAVRVLP